MEFAKFVVLFACCCFAPFAASQQQQQPTPQLSYSTLAGLVQYWHARNPGKCGIVAGGLQQAMQSYEQSCNGFRALPDLRAKTANISKIAKVPTINANKTKIVTDTRIINGCTVKNIQLAPFAVALNICGNLCSGTLVTDQHVLVAAHCFTKQNCIVSLNDNCQDYAYINTTPVFIGGASGRGATSTVPYQITHVAIHPQWNFDLDEYDLAIVQLDRPVPNAMPACLPDARMTQNVHCLIFGFGTNAFGDDMSQTPYYPLRVAKVQMASVEECWSTYGVRDEKVLFCARGPASRGTDKYVNNGGYADACQGDSGAGVVCPANDPRSGGQARWFVRGVVASGILRCGEEVGVYTHAVNVFSGFGTNNGPGALCSLAPCRAQGQTCRQSWQCCNQMICDQQTVCSVNGYCQSGKVCIKPTVLG